MGVRSAWARITSGQPDHRFEKAGGFRLPNFLLKASVITLGLIGPATAQERILISSDWGRATAEVVENNATRALVQKLPLTIEMRDHLRQEKTGDLPSPALETYEIEFESVQQASAAHDSPSYQEALKALGNAAKPDVRIVEGVS
jgi:hypothetical protein